MLSHNIEKDISEIEGVIFDMDGVLVDSEPAMAKASVEGMAHFGIHAEESDFIPYIGTGEETYLGRVLEKYGGSYSSEIASYIYDIFCNIAQKHIIAFPGAIDTIAKLHERGYKTAIASSSVKRKLDATIKAINMNSGMLDALVCGSDVIKRKPDPEIFLTASSKAALSPDRCLVVEDALSGVKAAKAAGMYCFGITTTYTADVLNEAGADFSGASVKELLKYLPEKCKERKK